MPKHKKIEPSTQTITENAENMNTSSIDTTNNINIPDHPFALIQIGHSQVDNCGYWKSKINPRHIVLFKDKKDEIEKKYGKDFWILQKEIQEGKVNFLEIDEKYLLVKLAGWRELAQLRGYSNVNYTVYNPSPQYVCAQCYIFWNNLDKTPNSDNSIEFSSIADAHLGNTYSFAQNYLSAIAENRAFCRAVRNFLNISIVSYEEMGPNSDNKNGNAVDEDTSPSNQQLLKNSVKDILRIEDFEHFKDFLRKEKNDGNISFEPSEIKAIKDANDIDELPSLFCVTLLRLVKSKQKSN